MDAACRNEARHFPLWSAGEPGATAAVASNDGGRDGQSNRSERCIAQIATACRPLGAIIAAEPEDVGCNGGCVMMYYRDLEVQFRDPRLQLSDLPESNRVPNTGSTTPRIEMNVGDWHLVFLAFSLELFLLRFLVTAFLLSRISKQNRLGA
jgi:hypothetical protein